MNIIWECVLSQQSSGTSLCHHFQGREDSENLARCPFTAMTSKHSVCIVSSICVCCLIWGRSPIIIQWVEQQRFAPIEQFADRKCTYISKKVGREEWHYSAEQKQLVLVEAYTLIPW